MEGPVTFPTEFKVPLLNRHRDWTSRPGKDRLRLEKLLERHPRDGRRQSTQGTSVARTSRPVYQGSYGNKILYSLERMELAYLPGKLYQGKEHLHSVTKGKDLLRKDIPCEKKCGQLTLMRPNFDARLRRRYTGRPSCAIEEIL